MGVEVTYEHPERGVVTDRYPDAQSWESDEQFVDVRKNITENLGSVTYTEIKVYNVDRVVTIEQFDSEE